MLMLCMNFSFEGIIIIREMKKNKKNLKKFKKAKHKMGLGFYFFLPLNKKFKHSQKQKKNQIIKQTIKSNNTT